MSAESVPVVETAPDELTTRPAGLEAEVAAKLTVPVPPEVASWSVNDELAAGVVEFVVGAPWVIVIAPCAGVDSIGTSAVPRASIDATRRVNANLRDDFTFSSLSRFRPTD